MPALRVTQRLMVDRVLTNYGYQTRRLMRLQDQLGTGQRINRPSDDPIDVRRSINTRTLIQRAEQYIDNINMTRPQHLECSTTIQQMQETIRRAHELTLQASNSSNSPEQLSYIAEEINQIIEGTLDSANHRTNNRYIFAGTRSRYPAFEAVRDVDGNITSVSYMGNSDRYELAISNTVRVALNEPGDLVFQGDVDIFEMLIGIREDMLSANYADLANLRLQELDTARVQLSRSLARVGAAQNRVDRCENELEDYRLHNEALLSNLIDADYAETVIELNMAQNAFQSALNAAGRVLRPSLLDFI